MGACGRGRWLPAACRSRASISSGISSRSQAIFGWAGGTHRSQIQTAGSDCRTPHSYEPPPAAAMASAPLPSAAWDALHPYDLAHLLADQRARPLPPAASSMQQQQQQQQQLSALRLSLSLLRRSARADVQDELEIDALRAQCYRRVVRLAREACGGRGACQRRVATRVLSRRRSARCPRPLCAEEGISAAPQSGRGVPDEPGGLSVAQLRADPVLGPLLRRVAAQGACTHKANVWRQDDDGETPSVHGAAGRDHAPRRRADASGNPVGQPGKEAQRDAVSRHPPPAQHTVPDAEGSIFAAASSRPHPQQRRPAFRAPAQLTVTSAPPPFLFLLH
jgi:hypothetical protein